MNRFEYRDGRFWKGGSPFFLRASDYQYYRDQRAHWADRLQKLKAAGVNCITFYIPWRHHLCWDGGKAWYDFTGKTRDNRDVVGFLREVQNAGLLMIAKPGPFVHSELNVGGLPDLVSPTFNESIPPARRHHDGPVVWCYDATKLPAPWDARFDVLVRDWLQSVREVLLPFVQPAGNVIALQLNDETTYCTSNDPPWNIGYESSGVQRYYALLATKYGTIDRYNEVHGTRFDSFELVPTPKLRSVADRTVMTPGLDRDSDLLHCIDWAEYQWRYRRDLYAQYEEYLDLPLPYLTNYAGITPPIEENIPDLDEAADERAPTEYVKLYPDWWFAMNRIDQDADIYHYGMISWLGVAAYDQDVFDRYINTARRARGINMEENWGFGMLYDAKSRYPIVPFYQTLVSVAGGATGYDIYCGVGTDYWDDSLDRVTKKQCPTFPSHAPIDEQGNCGPLYDAARQLNAWFAIHGQALLECEIKIDATYLLYAPYAAVSSWVPDASYWGLKDRAIPRCGYEGFEPFSRTLQQAGYAVAMRELEAMSDADLDACACVAIHTAFFMDTEAQQRLARFIARGGKAIISGELPEVDLEWRSCTLLREAVESHQDHVIYRRDNLFTEPDLPALLSQLGVVPQLTYTPGIRAYLHTGPRDQFLFFFSLDECGQHTIKFADREIPLELTLGPRSCGVLRLQDAKIIAHLIKGANEVEKIVADIEIRFGSQVVRGRGDFST